MIVNVYNHTKRKGYAKYKDDFNLIITNAKKYLSLHDDTTMSVIFVLNKKIREINRDYRNIDRATDVISFALQDDKSENDYFAEELGDIFINVEAAIDQAKEYDHSERREICFLFTHGLLHLCGFDHQNSEDEKKMIEYQKKILDSIIAQDE